MKNFTITTLFLSYLIKSSFGVTLAAHLGDTDPSTEGFVLVELDATVGPAIGDSGTEAWGIDSSGGRTYYSYSILGADETIANTKGWKLTMNLEILDTPDTVDYGVYSEYISSLGVFQMGFGSRPNGDPVISLYTAPGVFTEYTVTGGGQGFHNYEIVYNPDSSSADLSIDGVPQFSGWTGWNRPFLLSPGVTFGSYDPGHANWNEFTFSIIPEPSGFLLLGTGFCSLLTRRRRTELPSR